MNRYLCENKNSCALILGGGLNAYSIIRELYENQVENLILITEIEDFAHYSNKLQESRIIEPEPDKSILLSELRDIHHKYGFIIIFPVSDLYVYLLYELWQDIISFCYIPFNQDNVRYLFSKSDQYDFCKNNRIAFPKTKRLSEYLQSRDRNLNYPLLVKPDVWDRNTIGNKTFKTLVLNNDKELKLHLDQLTKLLKQGVNLLITEIIPGDDNAIYVYVAYRSKSGTIRNEWTCRKLSQHPEGYGVFCTVCNQAPNDLRILGREIFRKMNLYGINEIEFKYDCRDREYKYIETNFRTPLFNRIGHLTGVDLCYAQYLDAQGIQLPKQKQIVNKKIHYVHLKWEFINLLSRPAYISKLWYNLTHSDNTYFALFDPSDLKPLFYDVISSGRSISKKAVKKIWN